ncbi:uncharacterized protein LOC100178546 [Ciona intestinalis]
MKVLFVLYNVLLLSTQYSDAAIVVSGGNRPSCLDGGIKATCFRCLNCNLIIPREEICDGKFDCRDLSDELLCPEKRIRYDSRLQNALARLQIGVDLLKEDSAVELVHRMCIPECVIQRRACEYCRPGEFMCSPTITVGQPCGCVVKSKICDGVVDCAGGEDENYCGTELMQRYQLKPANKKRNATNSRITNQYLTTLAQSRIRCEMIECISKFPRPCNTPREHGARSQPHSRHRDSWQRIAPQTRSGLIDIFPGVAVADTPRIMNLNASAVFSYLRENRNPGSPPSLEQYRLHGNVSLLYGPNDTIPDDVNVVKLEKVCDGTPECPGLEDELSCPGKFYCENREPLYIDKLRKMDGVADCTDSSDEWEPTTVHHSLSSRYNLIDNWTLQVLVWVMAITALVGNMVVAWNTVIELVKINRVATASAIMQKHTQHSVKEAIGDGMVRTLSGITVSGLAGSSRRFRTGGGMGGQRRLVKTWNSVLVLNLATADLIMGIYLLWLGVMSFLYEGKTNQSPYWSIDREWRTGATCNILGTILVVSSQTSVFTLVSLTSLRLYTVIKPFASYHLKFRYLFLVCLLTWSCAMMLAIAPIMPATEEVFISQAWVPFPQFKPPVINRTDGDTLMRGIAYILNESLVVGQPDPPAGQMTWAMMVDFLKRVAPNHSEWQFFGYYSEDSVCMPKLYVSKDDLFWGHAVSLLTVNFISVIYIAVAYLIIYYKSKSDHKIPRSKPQTPDVENDSKPTAGQPERKRRLSSTSMASWGRRASILTRRDETPDRTAKYSLSARRSSHQVNRKGRRISKNSTAEMQRRIALLVATDCACWIPICVMGFISVGGHRIPDTAYAITAIGLMPINSALNPLLYSRIMRSLWSKGWSSLRSRISTKSTSSSQRESTSSSKVYKQSASKKISTSSFFSSAIAEEEDNISDIAVSSDVISDDVITNSAVADSASREHTDLKEDPIEEESDVDYGIDSDYDEDEEEEDPHLNYPCVEERHTELPMSLQQNVVK